MIYTVYIIHSKSLDRYYIGQTKDFIRRFQRHNNSEMNYTKKGVPWEEVKTFEVETRSEAIKLERKIKKRGAKRYLENSAS